MTDIRRLEPGHLAAAVALITGYVSHARYAASKQESEAGARIELRREPLPAPYIKQYEPLDAESLQACERALAEGLSLGQFDGPRLVGVALAEARWWNKTLWVWEFHIAEDRRGHGLGRRLMEALAENARAAGLRAIVCETQSTNAPAIDFYRQLGFEIDGVDLSYYTNDDAASGEVAIFMKRKTL